MIKNFEQFFKQRGQGIERASIAVSSAISAQPAAFFFAIRKIQNL